MSQATVQNVGNTISPDFRDSSRASSANAQALHSFVQILTRRWQWIALSVVICAFLAIGLTSISKPTYGATATIELNKGSAGSLDLGLGDGLSSQLTSGGDSLLTDLQTETAILRGDSLALAVIERLGLVTQSPFVAPKTKDPGLLAEIGLPLEDAPRTRTRLLGIFRAYLKVEPIRGTRLIEVTYESHDPVQAAQIANALIESYKNQYLQSHYAATAEASDWLTKQLSDLKSNVEESEKKLTDFEKESGILSLNMMMPTDSGSGSMGGSPIHSVVIQKLDALNGELTAAEANRIEKEAIYRFSQGGNADVILGIGNDPLAAQTNSMVLTQGGGLSNLQQLRQQDEQLKVAIAEASTTFGANNRHLKEMQVQQRTLEDEMRTEMQLITRRAQADFELAEHTEKELRRQFEEQQAAAGKLNEKTVQFAVLSQEAFSRKKLYEDLYTRLQEANVSAGIKATNITIVDPARSQSNPIRPQPTRNLALGIFFGLFLGFAAAFTADSVDRTVSTTAQIEEITGRPVIGVIPTFGRQTRSYGGYRRRREDRKSSRKPESQAEQRERETQKTESPVAGQLWMLTHPNSSAAEAFRSLRTSIMLSRAGGGPRALLITGCIPGEGKTTLTMNLAIAFAQHNKKVIIIEADMRRPRMKHMVNAPHDAGLSNVLAGTLSEEEAIVRGVHVPTLDVLQAGPYPPMPSEMLGSEAFDELLQSLRARYDMILIDSPPALIVTDAVSMSGKVDAVLWVAQAGVVTRPLLVRAAESIQRNRMPVIGFVVNRLDRRMGGYGYGYEYYGAYYREGDEA